MLISLIDNLIVPFLVRISKTLLIGSGLLMLVASILVTANILSRNILFVQVPGATEFTTYAFAISISWAMPDVLLNRINLRIDLVYRLIPVDFVRAFLDVFSSATLGGFLLIVTYYSTGYVYDNWNNGTVSTTPLATKLFIPQSLWLSGLILVVVVWMVVFARSLIALSVRDYESVFRLLGPKGH